MLRFCCVFFSGTSKRGPCRVKEARIKEREKVGVYITSVTGPGDFFCQLTKTSAQLDDLMNEIEEYYRPLHQQEKAYTDVQVTSALESGHIESCKG